MQEKFYTIRERIVTSWPTYGPSIVGAVLVLLALFVGYRIWTGRSQVAAPVTDVTDTNLTMTVEPTPTPVVPNTEPSSNLVVGSGGTVITPTPAQVAVASQATDSSATKGGVPTTLPETGFPLFAVLPGFGLAVAGGFKLLKSKKV